MSVSSFDDDGVELHWNVNTEDDFGIIEKYKREKFECMTQSNHRLPRGSDTFILRDNEAFLNDVVENSGTSEEPVLEPLGSWVDKQTNNISEVGNRLVECEKREFECVGMLHSQPIQALLEINTTHQGKHKVNEVRPTRSICHDVMIKDCTPFDCWVYWKTRKEQCASCFLADEKIRCWRNLNVE